MLIFDWFCWILATKYWFLICCSTIGIFFYQKLRFFFCDHAVWIGKTTWISNLIIEHEYHFQQKIKKVIYFYKETCKSIEKLKTHLSKEKGLEVLFTKKFPDGNFLDFCKVEEASTIIVIDDFYWDAATDENIRSALISLSSIWNHHKLITILCSDNCCK